MNLQWLSCWYFWNLRPQLSLELYKLARIYAWKCRIICEEIIVVRKEWYFTYFVCSRIELCILWYISYMLQVWHYISAITCFFAYKKLVGSPLSELLEIEIWYIELNYIMLCGAWNISVRCLKHIGSRDSLICLCSGSYTCFVCVVSMRSNNLMRVKASIESRASVVNCMYVICTCVRDTISCFHIFNPSS